MEISSLSAISSYVSQANSSSSSASAGQATRSQTRPHQGTRATSRPNEAFAQERANQAVIERLKTRDREVRAHEQAHLARAGGLAKGGARFSFQKGPDGRLYAVSGSIQIDASPVPGNPEATIQKARQIRAAALAPANPSAQDRAVAVAADRMEAQARLEATEQRSLRQQATTRTPSSSADTSPHRTIDLYA